MISLIRAAWQTELRVPMFVGLSTDGYPDSDDPAMRNGARIYHMDTGAEYEYSADDNAWHPIPTGGGGGSTPVSAVNNGVNFIDYDGTVVYSWEAKDIPNKTELPSNPTHDGLISQGWNWDLSSIKEYFYDENCKGCLYVGQTYITDDGATRLHISLEEGRTAVELHALCDDTIQIDWGDGTERETFTGSYEEEIKITGSHQYNSAGDYVISIYGGDILYTYLYYTIFTIDEDEFYSPCLPIEINLGSNVTQIEYAIFAGTEYATVPRGVISVFDDSLFSDSCLRALVLPMGISDINISFFYGPYLTTLSMPSTVQSLEITNNINDECTINITLPLIVSEGFDAASVFNSAFKQGYCKIVNSNLPSSLTTSSLMFNGCYNLKNVAIPKGITDIGDGAFSGCSIRNIFLPNTVTEISGSAFSGCVRLSHIRMPSNITYIGYSAFDSCNLLNNITIPSSVTEIDEYAFLGCSGLSFIKFEGTTPPTLYDSYVFYGVPTDCIIYVPSGSLSAYTSAANYPHPDVYTYVEY